MGSGARRPCSPTGDLVECIVSGQPPGDLDQLLRWLVAPDAPDVAGLDLEFRRRHLDRSAARRLSLLLLDEILFRSAGGDARAVLGLDENASATALRRRYHLLMRVYHPDLAPEDSAWVTERAERINKAHASLRSSGRSRAPKRSSVPRLRPRPRTSLRFGIRRSLGSPRVLRRRAIGGLVMAGVALVLHTCVVNRVGLPGPPSGRPEVSAPAELR